MVRPPRRRCLNGAHHCDLPLFAGGDTSTTRPQL
jgi:hypothetical protein